MAGMRKRTAPRLINARVRRDGMRTVTVSTTLLLGSQSVSTQKTFLGLKVSATGSGCWLLLFAFTFGAAFFTLIFYLLLYFQSVKGVSATKSGIDVIPFLLSTVLFSMLAGGLPYVPFALVGSVLFSIGAGLLTTFTISTPFAKWFGYQILAGAGVGLILQIPLLAVQTCLPLEDVPIGTACVVFFQTLGGALFIAIAQTLFQNGVIRGVHKFIPGLDPSVLLGTGATEIRDALARLGMLNELDSALRAYMVGLVDTVVASWFLEWKSVKDPEVKKKMEAAGAGVAV